MRTVIALGHDGMGHGDAELGRKILGTFLKKSTAIREITGVVFFNSGVKLVAEGSPVLVELRQLHDAGVDIRPCATCIDAFGLRDKIAVGEISNMDEIVAELNGAERVITL
ncbi:MAG: DsrE family protein [Planctomycetes bacterium]|nr:DsrE family protein [Planctomycetota bacterium]